MAQINSLSLELLEHIFDYVVGDSDKNKYSRLSSTSEIFDACSSKITSLLLVNKTFYTCAQRLHNRHKHFVIRQEVGDIDTERTAKIISALLHDPSREDLRRSIRHLTITCERGWRGPRPAPPELLDDISFQQRIDQLANAVAELPNLRTLTFRGNFSIPLSLLSVLEKHQPQCHLHIRDWQRTRADMDHNDPAEIALVNSPNLRSITAGIRGDGGTRLDLRFHALRRIVSLSPHLESVEIEQGNFGWLIRSHSYEERAKREELGALFTTSKPSQNNIKSLKSKGGNHLKMLEDVTDLKKLESLDIDMIYDSAFFLLSPYRRPRFRNLKHVSIQMGSWYGGHSRYTHHNNSVQDFLACCSSLESLTLTDRQSRVDLSAILANHGTSLRKLHLHESERVTAEGPPDHHSLNFDEIREVRNWCPELEEFTVDLDRYPTSKATYKILQELARFEKLQKLTLYFPLGLKDMSSHSNLPPLLDFPYPQRSHFHPDSYFDRTKSGAWLESIYSFLLHQKQVHNTVPLKELRVKLGEWERRSPVSLAAPWERFEGQNKRYFILTRSHDSGDMVEVRTLGLEDINHENSVKEERELRPMLDWELFEE
ncbi:hypothetical protein V8E51_016536 [Hyaloscypha variabilis]